MHDQPLSISVRSGPGALANESTHSSGRANSRRRRVGFPRWSPSRSTNRSGRMFRPRCCAEAFLPGLEGERRQPVRLPFLGEPPPGLLADVMGLPLAEVGPLVNDRLPAGLMCSHPASAQVTMFQCVASGP